MIKIKVGTLTLTEPRDVRVPQEYAAYDETVRVEPGTYDAFAYIDWTHDGGGYYHIYDLAAWAEGTTTRAWYGDAARSRALIGRKTVVSIPIPRSGVGALLCKVPGMLVLDPVVHIVEWQPQEGPPMWRIELRPGVKIEITKPAPWSGATSEGVASMPEVAA